MVATLVIAMLNLYDPNVTLDRVTVFSEIMMLMLGSVVVCMVSIYVEHKQRHRIATFDFSSELPALEPDVRVEALGYASIFVLGALLLIAVYLFS